jgi:hypothetical protein
MEDFDSTMLALDASACDDDVDDDDEVDASFSE